MKKIAVLLLPGMLFAASCAQQQTGGGASHPGVLSEADLERMDARGLPYGLPAQGKPGYVASPYAPKEGYVDVRGFPRGTKVQCPYTGKVFLVP